MVSAGDLTGNPNVGVCMSDVEVLIGLLIVSILIGGFLCFLNILW